MRQSLNIIEQVVYIRNGHHFIYLLSFKQEMYRTCSLTGTYQPNNLTCSQLCGFIAQLVEQNPVVATWFVQVSIKDDCLRTVPTDSKVFLRGLLNMREGQLMKNAWLPPIFFLDTKSTC